jgi:hypothetical protein
MRPVGTVEEQDDPIIGGAVDPLKRIVTLREVIERKIPQIALSAV